MQSAWSHKSSSPSQWTQGSASASCVPLCDIPTFCTASVCADSTHRSCSLSRSDSGWKTAPSKLFHSSWRWVVKVESRKKSEQECDKVSNVPIYIFFNNLWGFFRDCVELFSKIVARVVLSQCSFGVSWRCWWKSKVGGSSSRNVTKYRIFSNLQIYIFSVIHGVSFRD